MCICHLKRHFPFFLSEGKDKGRRQSLQIYCLGKEVDKMKLSDRNKEVIKKIDSTSVAAAKDEEKETGKLGTKSKQSKQNNYIL